MKLKKLSVAPYTGAWIEITSSKGSYRQHYVAPYTGAWIEIRRILMKLKKLSVAPYTGAWIEIQIIKGIYLNLNRRTLHGCVD